MTEAISVSLDTHSLSLSHFSSMAVNSCDEGQDASSISVLPDEGTTNLQCETQFSFLSHSEVPKPINTQKCLDANLSCQKYINLEMENGEAYSSCRVDTDIENGNSGIPKINEESMPRLKFEGPLTQIQRALQRQISLQIGEKFMHLLENDSLVLPTFTSRDKSMTEKFHESPNSRTRKYKRSVSFNSRKVVLLFSALSSMGTIILIYLTLRVRQMGDVSVHA